MAYGRRFCCCCQLPAYLVQPADYDASEADWDTAVSLHLWGRFHGGTDCRTPATPYAGEYRARCTCMPSLRQTDDTPRCQERSQFRQRVLELHRLPRLPRHKEDIRGFQETGLFGISISRHYDILKIFLDIPISRYFEFLSELTCSNAENSVTLYNIWTAHITILLTNSKW